MNLVSPSPFLFADAEASLLWKQAATLREQAGYAGKKSPPAKEADRPDRTLDPNARDTEDEVPGRRWEMWQAEAAGGQELLFLKRLEWDGLTEEAARNLLDGANPDLMDPSAGWLSFLQALPLAQASADETSHAMVDRVIRDQPELPFGPVFRLPLLVALQLSQEGPPLQNGLISPEATAAALGGLLKELCQLHAPVLVTGLQKFLETERKPADPLSTSGHDAFCAAAGSTDGWKTRCQEFPVLARLTGILSSGWAREWAEFLGRLDQDWSLLTRSFFPQQDAPPLTLDLVSAGISDRHDGAGTVKILTFSGNRRLVYKRRPLELEADFHEMLETLRKEGLECAPPSLKVLPRGGYGWVEFAMAAPVKSPEEFGRWFETAGSLLCLMHVLGGNDGHMENIIATPGGPVLIDVETLLQPTLATASSQASRGTFQEAARKLQDSVLQTGLLPQWQRGPRGTLYDIGGLTGTGGYESPVPRQVWENTGTDALAAVWRRPIARGLENLPQCHGHRRSASRHLLELCHGFATTWKFLSEHPGLLRQVLPWWEHALLRVLLRPTTHYAALLERSFAPGSLVSGIDRSLIFEAVRLVHVRNHPERPLLWPALEAEIAALEAGDIPAFYVHAGGHDLVDAHGRIVADGVFAESALNAALARLNHLDHEGLQRQLGLIGSAFIQPGSNCLGEVPLATPQAVPVDYEALLRANPRISPEGLIQTAQVLGDQIIGSAIRGQDGFVTWLLPTALRPDQKNQRGVSYYLYDGAAGMSLFLGALAAVTQSDAARSTALAALEPVKAILASAQSAQLISREGIGGASGLASLVYVFPVLAELLNEPPLLDRGLEISQFIDAGRIGADQQLDVVSGSAGAILALLALHQHTGASGPLQRAVQCGIHLLEKSVRTAGDGLAWPSWPDRLLLAGYSHGAAGTGLALHKLGLASGEARFLDAAQAALRYERTLFDPSAANWPILLPGGRTRLASTWCHGAPGVLLARAGMRAEGTPETDAEISRELEIARSTTLAAGLSAIDHLCCGTMGRVAILHDTASVLGGSRNLELAHLGATLTIRRAQQRKAFSLQTDPVRNGVFQPGFFRGTSGIGYTFLRLARPDLIPSVLQWETRCPATAGVPA